jgi:hypothetical protein
MVGIMGVRQRAREDTMQILFTREPVREQWSQGFGGDSTREPARAEVARPVRRRVKSAGTEQKLTELTKEGWRREEKAESLWQNHGLTGLRACFKIA